MADLQRRSNTSSPHESALAGALRCAGCREDSVAISQVPDNGREYVRASIVVGCSEHETSEQPRSPGGGKENLNDSDRQPDVLSPFEKPAGDEIDVQGVLTDADRHDDMRSTTRSERDNAGDAAGI